MKAEAPKRLYLEPDQIVELLDAVGELDAEDRLAGACRRPLLATFGYAGLRVGELLGLHWRDADIGRGVLHVRESKTDADVRDVEIQPSCMTNWQRGRRGLASLSRRISSFRREPAGRGTGTTSGGVCCCARSRGRTSGSRSVGAGRRCLTG